MAVVAHIKEKTSGIEYFYVDTGKEPHYIGKLL